MEAVPRHELAKDVLALARHAIVSTTLLFYALVKFDPWSTYCAIYNNKMQVKSIHASQACWSLKYK